MDFQESNRRLLVLADFLETVPEENFNMTTWFEGSDDDVVGHEECGTSLANHIAALDQVKSGNACGTVACALGWTTAIPEFKDYFKNQRMPFFKPEKVGWDLFGLADADPQFSELFCPLDPPCKYDSENFDTDEEYKEWLEEYEAEMAQFNENMKYRVSSDATPKEVASHIRKFVANRTLESSGLENE